MLRAFLSASLPALALLLAPAASAALIDFQSQSLGNNLNPLVLPGATLTTVGGFNFIADAFGSRGLCPSTSSANSGDCSVDLEVLFDSPSSGISFAFAGNNTNTVGSDIGDVQIFSGATFLGTVDVIVVDTDTFAYDLVGLSGFSDVTRLLISSTDFNGVVYDDFTFTPSSSAVPEPASWQMMIGGFALFGAAFRRRHH